MSWVHHGLADLRWMTGQASAGRDNGAAGDLFRLELR